MPTECVIGGVVYESDGTTPIASLSVKARNERTNEVHPTTTTTNSTGHYIISCNNFTEGWAVGDLVTLYILYTEYEVSTTVTLVDGGITQDLTVTSVAASDSLRYFTVQQFYDYTGLLSTDLPAARVIRMGFDQEAELDNMTGSKFDSNSSSYYSVTDEYHDVRNNSQRDFFLEKAPLVTLPKFEVNGVLGTGTSSSRFDSSSAQVQIWINLAYDLVDACDATTSWAISTDGAITLNQTAGEFNEGTGCLNIAKSGTSSATLTVSKTFGTTHDISTRSAYVDLYFDSAADFNTSDSIEIRFGSSSSAYYYKKWDISELAAQSWTSLGISTDVNEGTTGSPDVTAIDYLALIFTTAASTTTLTAGDIKVDNVRVGNKGRIRTELDTSRVSIISGYDHAIQGPRNVRVSYTYGRSSVPADIRKLAILMTMRMALKSTIAKALISGRDEFTPTTIDALDPEINRILKRYKRLDIKQI